MTVSVAFLKADDSVVSDDSHEQDCLSALLYHCRRYIGRYGSDAFTSVAQSAGMAYDLDGNNSSITSVDALSSFFLPTAAVSPATGAHSTAVALTITGTGFLPGVTVSINSEACTSVVRVSQTEVTCHTPADLAADTYDVVVLNPNGASVTVSGAYTAT